MCHRLDHFASSVARQLGIRVERDHVRHSNQLIYVAGRLRKTIGSTSQGSIQVRELAPLAFVSHPHTFRFIPFPIAMQQEERVFSSARIEAIESLNSLPSLFDEVFVARHRHGISILEVGQQSILEAAVAVSQGTNF